MRVLCAVVFFNGSLTTSKAQASFSLPPFLCVDEVTIVSANTGTFPATNYLWLTSPSGGVFSAPNGTVSHLSFPVAGTYTVILGMTSGTMSSLATQTIIIHPPPTLTLTASPASLCAGQNATLTVSGALSYVWTPTVNLYFFSNTTAYTTPNVTEVYTISGADAFGCLGITTYTLDVQNYPVPLISATSASICAGNTVTLTASGAANYSWTGSSFTGSVKQPTLAVGPGSYTLAGANGVCGDTAFITIGLAPNILASILASRMTICKDLGDSLIPVDLTASGATYYSWAPFDPVRMTFSLGPVTAVSPSVTTCYTLTASTAACQGTNAVCIGVYSCTAMEEQGGNNVADVFPNPVSDKLTLTMRHSAQFEISIINITGRLMFQDKASMFEGIGWYIDTGSFPPGVYMLCLREEGKSTHVTRFIRE